MVVGARRRGAGSDAATPGQGSAAQGIPAPIASSAATLGFWAAALATVLTIVFVVLALVVRADDWVGVEAYMETFETIQVVQLVPVLLLPPVVVVLMACVHHVVPATRRLFSHIAVMFAGVYAAIITTNYVIQLFVVRLNLTAGDPEGLALLAMPNPTSVFVGLEISGYGFFGLMALFAAGAFTGPLLARWIRRLLAATGGTGIAGAIGGLADLRILMLTGFGLSLLAFLAAAVLLGAHFRRLAQAPASALTGGDAA